MNLTRTSGGQRPVAVDNVHTAYLTCAVHTPYEMDRIYICTYICTAQGHDRDFMRDTTEAGGKSHSEIAAIWNHCTLKVRSMESQCQFPIPTCELRISTGWVPMVDGGWWMVDCGYHD